MRRSTEGISSVAVLVGNPPSESKWPDGKMSKEKFANIKAETWWICRERAHNSYQMLLHLTDPENAEAMEHEIDDLLMLPGDEEGSDAMTLNSQLSLVKWQTTVGGKIIIESKKDLEKRGIQSPDHADSLMLTFTPESTAEKLMKAFA
jgi:hypothetical protein